MKTNDCVDSNWGNGKGETCVLCVYALTDNVYVVVYCVRGYACVLYLYVCVMYTLLTCDVLLCECERSPTGIV